MRERRKPKRLKFSSLPWLVSFLNLAFDSDRPGDRKNVEKFLAESGAQDDSATARKIQQKMIDLIDLAIKARSPEGLVWELNEYVARSSESWALPAVEAQNAKGQGLMSDWFGSKTDLVRSYPPVRAHWYVRPLKDVSVIDAGQAVLKMGKSKWVVQPAPLMFGTEGRVWLSIAQCLTNGEFGRLRRCFHCGRFFVTDDARRRFCIGKHQREYDREASKARVKVSREKKKEKRLGIKPAKRKAKEPPSLITEPQRFAEFLNLARGNVIPRSELALFIKRKIPGDWRTVKGWLRKNESPDAIWLKVSDKTKDVFREDLWKAV
ncbi:MAG: hypothetical protein HY695_11260 [Deltaproteobacteria bacterium]|nr:hypothetical protein [Deltaproteobacteria bacterium]